MSDDNWRRDDDFSEFGSLFDDAEPTQNMPEVDRAAQSAARDARAARDDRDRAAREDRDRAAREDPDDAERPDADDGLSFGASDTGSLPHWTEPPTGEVPKFDADAVVSAAEAEHEDLDVWSSFSSEAPVWKDDEPAAPAEPPGRRSGQHRRVADEVDTVTAQHRRVTGESDVVAQEPSRITIGTDPSGMPRRAPQQTGRRRGTPPRRTRPSAGPPPPAGRDMPAAIAVGLVIAAAFTAALMYEPVAVAALVVVVLGLAAVEFYDKVAEKGYRPAIVPGIVTCVAGPLAAYWLGSGTIPLVIAFGFMATAGSFIGARSVEAGPMPNVSITTLGIIWIGVLGSFAMLILRFSTQLVSQSPELQAIAENRGTDTIFLLAVGVVANDVGALFIGSAVGNTPLRRWISPNKTVEGLIGGTLFTIAALMFVGLTDRSTTWTSNWDLLALAVVIAVMAPMGDLVESMFKRNLDVKDFGSIIKGHGGVLDRFDAFLFVLPPVYYLTLVLEPWAA